MSSHFGQKIKNSVLKSGTKSVPAVEGVVVVVVVVEVVEVVVVVEVGVEVDPI